MSIASSEPLPDMLSCATWQTLRATLFPGCRPSVAQPHWPHVVSLANYLLVGTALWPAIKLRGGIEGVPQELVAYLEAMHAANAERNRAALSQLEQACRHLNNIGITPTLFKGGALLVAGTPEVLGARFCSDFDLLVPAQRIQEAQTTLLENDYEEVEMTDLDDPESHRHLNPIVHVASQTCIELHRTMVPRECDSLFSESDQQSMTVPFELGAARIKVPDATAGVLIAVIHSELIDEYIHRYIIPLRTILDVYALQHSCAGVGEPQWQSVQARLGSRAEVARFRCFAAIYRRVTGARLGCEGALGWRDRLRVSLCWRAVSSPRIQRWSARWERLFPSYLESLNKSHWQKCRAVCSALGSMFTRWHSTVRPGG